MRASTRPRTLVLGNHPRTSVRALVARLIIAELTVILWFVSPTVLLSSKLSLLTAVVGFFLAVAVCRYKGCVLVGILVVVLPIFALNAASTTILEPASLELGIRAARNSAWYTIGVALLIVGSLGYAIGGMSLSGS